MTDRAPPAAYRPIADLPLTVDAVDYQQFEQDTSSEFTRVTTVFQLRGEGTTGRGEDVTYDTEDHERLAAAIDDGAFPLPTGSFTFDEFSAALDDADLFPREGPERADSFDYRRWGVESAALDLALRQNDTTLPALLDRRHQPVRFVASTRLGDPPSVDRVDEVRSRNPGIGFKLDPTPDWGDELIDELRARDAVRIVDLKGHYEGTEVDNDADPAFYRRIVNGFPDAVVEDPQLTDDTRPVFDGAEGRVSWDSPIHGLDDVAALPWEPSWLNVKPSRFGTLESLLRTIEWALDAGVNCYGGGQFELAVGRGQAQELAALFYPDGPNDLAPSSYNESSLPPELPRSPIAVPAPGDHAGFGF
ncbi:enolase [Halolamina rubra]|uniref:enolase n=1 Tax=Halolamina rubra TaxID=1380430 RepID=UPI000678E336|nr:enolase [Halolamina rubra]